MTIQENSVNPQSATPEGYQSTGVPSGAILNSQLYDAVLLISFGGPTKEEDVRPFLANVLKGIPIPQERVEEVVRHYHLIGGASPLNEITERQARALEKLLAQVGPAWPVKVGMRNWPPLITDVLESLVLSGAKKVLAVILSAHRSEASVRRYTAVVDAALRQLGPKAPQVEYAAPWFDHPLFLEAVTQRVQDAVQGWSEERRRKASWIFTAHSIPTAMAETSTYVEDLQASIAGVVSRVGLTSWQLAYQSRSGGPSEPWLGPSVLEVLEGEAKRGVKEVVVIPIGFVSDHVEVLYDLDVEARKAAREAGMNFIRVPTVGFHPTFIAMLASLVRSKAGIAFSA